ncbi:hypothetical protein [Novosphingobium sp. HII-3]|uniref:hypothetical protein n=1 Tax=Novosphingobium sp. HII-3 TaxID=2075565 RepID=UPI000CDB1F45|nr:hypothetical protein [Novosphingobium sp. HII-3]
MNHNTLAVTEPATWLARGRSAAEADALAKAWRDFPDLAIDAPADARMARTRERTIAMRPIFEAMSERSEAERQATNFAFTRRQVENGEANAQDEAVIRARDEHGYEWDCSVQYAQGWYAATAGWEHRPGTPTRRQAAVQLRAAYDHGFADGGGDTGDVFDAARRANIAAAVRDAALPEAAQPLSGKLRPSLWPLPQDTHRPVSWQRRAVILTELDLQPPPGRDGQPSRRSPAIDLIRERSNDTATIIVLTTKAGFVDAERCSTCSTTMTKAQADELIADAHQGDILRSLLASREIDDLLVTAQGEYLRVLDAFSDAIPVLRTMERTRNTPLQQRAHLATWLDRGRLPGQNIGAGHIRWSKAAKGLSAKLGEFTVRYAGPAPERGHLIRVSMGDASRAEGFVTADHAPLSADICVSSKAKLRQEMTQALRRFGGATRLSAGLPF